jgi:hypothetical protein
LACFLGERWLNLLIIYRFYSRVKGLDCCPNFRDRLRERRRKAKSGEKGAKIKLMAKTKITTWGGGGSLA